jgi:hypothetical protein
MIIAKTYPPTDWPMLVAALEDEVGSLAKAVGTAQAAFR